MEQDKTDAPDRQKKVPGGFDWTRRSGKTPTGNTGPDGGQSGSSHYIYAEMSDPQSRDDETRCVAGGVVVVVAGGRGKKKNNTNQIEKLDKN